MPNTGPSPLTLRLMACAESFSHQEEGAVSHDDWPGLVGILERELTVVQRLASENTSRDEKLAKRAELLRQRYAVLSQRIAEAQERDAAELQALGESTRRVNDVRQAYLRNCA